MRKQTPLLNWMIVFFMFTIIGCKKDNPEPDPTNPPTTTNSYIRFEHNVNQQPIEYDSIMYTNGFGNEFSIETIRYFISNVVLVQTNGDSIPITDAIYVDPRENGYGKKQFAEPIPNGEYTKIVFTFGLDAVMNQTGLFNNFPEAAMEWPVMMGGGYHYMKLEGKYEDQGSSIPFNFHTGPLNNNNNYFKVVLPMSLNVTEETFDITLSMEIQNWFKNPNSFDLTQISGGMMGDQTMQELVKNNGHDVFTVD